MIKDAIDRIKKIASIMDDDDPDKIEMLNIEGDYNSLIRWAIIKRNEHLSNALGCDVLVKKYTYKKKSHENKAENIKGLIEWIMDAANELKFTCDVGSVSFRENPPKPYITDESILPKDYINTVNTVNKSKINEDIKAGLTIEGVSIDNGSRSLTIR
jgi:hypothetical protein